MGQERKSRTQKNGIAAADWTRRGSLKQRSEFSATSLNVLDQLLVEP